MEASQPDPLELEGFESNEQWEAAKYITKGSSCYILLAQDKASQETAIIKLFKDNLKSLTAKTEAELMMNLSHPRIIRAKRYLSEVSFSKRECLRPILTSALVLEYAPEGDLLQLIQKHQGLPEVVARTYFLQIVNAIEYLHTSKICHLDIKPDNVLLDTKFGAKLTDFGFAQKVSGDGKLTKVIGTKPYLSPEMHARVEYNAFQSDLFALGITLFIMISGVMPFTSARPDDEIYQNFKEEKYQEFWDFHEGLKKSRSLGRSYYSATLKSLINSMLAYKPENRLDLSQIRSHFWCKGFILSDEELDGFLRGRVKLTPDLEPI